MSDAEFAVVLFLALMGAAVMIISYIIAYRKGRSGIAMIIISLVLTPVVALVVALLLMPDYTLLAMRFHKKNLPTTYSPK